MFKKSFRKDINGLRAIAVISVVFFHFQLPGFDGGFVGVDVFFVISGFLMTQIIYERVENNSFSFSSYLINRVFRIVPALSFLSVCLMILGWFLLVPSDYTLLCKNLIASSFFFSNIFYLKQPGYFDVSAQENLLLHTWSLSVEWQFYLIYPVLVVILYKLFSGSLMKKILLLGTIFSLVLSVFLSKSYPEQSYYLLHTRCWEMLCGGLIFFSKLKILPKYKTWVEAFGVMAIFLSVFFLSSDNVWPGWLATAPVLGGMAILAANNSQSVIWIVPGVQWIGKISYSLYLWHWPIFAYLKYIEEEPDWITLTLGLIGSIIFAAISYRYIEKKFVAFHKGRALMIRPLLTAVSLSIFPVVFGIVVVACAGAPNRLDDQQRKLFKASTDWDYSAPNKTIGEFELRIIGPTNKKVLFVGDSLIEQYYPWASKYVNEGNPKKVQFYFLTAAGCSPIPFTVRDNDKCNNINNFLSIVAHENIKHVVLGAFWIEYFIENKNLSYFTIGNKKYPSNSRIGIEKSFENLTIVLKQLKNKNVNVYLLLPTPISDQWDSKRLLRESFISDRKVIFPEKIEVDYPNLSNLRKRLKKVGIEGGASVIDPIECLCQKMVCETKDENGIPFYKDKIHFRPFYVMNHLSYLDEIMNSL